MKHLEMSQHAMKRSQQRGIPQSVIDLILWYGTPRPRPGGAEEYVVLDKDISRIESGLKHLLQQVERLKGKAVLVKDDTIVTEYHLR